jgi:hypothetical protein
MVTEIPRMDIGIRTWKARDRNVKIAIFGFHPNYYNTLGRNAHPISFLNIPELKDGTNIQYLDSNPCDEIARGVLGM